MNRVQALVDFAKQRLVKPATKTRTFRALWNRRTLKGEQLENIRRVIQAGQALQTLVERPEWQEVLSVRAFLQTAEQARALIPDEHGLHQYTAAVKWQAIQELFHEIDRRVKTGQQARKELA